MGGECLQLLFKSDNIVGGDGQVSSQAVCFMPCRVDVAFPVLDASLKIAESVCEVDITCSFCVSVVFDQVGCMGSIIKLFLESCLVS